MHFYRYVPLQTRIFLIVILVEQRRGVDRQPPGRFTLCLSSRNQLSLASRPSFQKWEDAGFFFQKREKNLYKTRFFLHFSSSQPAPPPPSKTHPKKPTGLARLRCLRGHKEADRLPARKKMEKFLFSPLPPFFTQTKF